MYNWLRLELDQRLSVLELYKDQQEDSRREKEAAAATKKRTVVKEKEQPAEVVEVSLVSWLLFKL